MVLALWPYVMSNARIDENSQVELNPRMLSGIFGEPVESIEKAIDFLCAPDPHSRTSSEDGRRLIKVGSFAYKVVNLEKYRDSECDDTKRKYWREYRSKRRSKGKDLRKKTNKKPCVQVNTIPVQVNVQHADADADADAARNKREREVELPHNFPKSPDDAVKQCEGSLCMDCAFITKLYNSAMSKLGKDGNGQPILSFRHYVAKHWPGEVSKREENKINGNGHVEISGADKIVFNKEYERVLQAIRDLKAGYGDHQAMDQADAIKIKSLVARRNELRTTLHITI